MSEFEKTISIEGYGDVILRKHSFADKCKLRGKVIKISLDPLTKKESQEIDSSALFYWTTLLSIKSLPDQPKFYILPLAQQAKILEDQNMADNLEKIMKEAIQFNQLNAAEIGKKNNTSSQGPEQ